MRLIDVGCLFPRIFHGFYEGVARAATESSEPIFIWGRTEPHICIGQAQSAAAELAPQFDRIVVQRKLGGGAVWIDQSQFCVIAIIPTRQMSLRPAQWFEALLAPMQATFHAFGLEVEPHDRDLWLAGRKIAGSGAATIGEAAVIGSSFLLEFPHARFAECIAAPSMGFRQWLEQALRRSITTWSEYQIPPAEEAIKRAFIRALNAIHGVEVVESEITAPQLRQAEESASDRENDEPLNRRLVPYGVKINAATFLTERAFDGMDVRILTEQEKIKRLACANREIPLAEPLSLDARHVASRLSDAGFESPQRWADCVMRTAFTGG